MDNRDSQNMENAQKYTPAVPDLSKETPKDIQEKLASSAGMQQRAEAG